MLVLLFIAALVFAALLWRLARGLRDAERQLKEVRLLQHEIEELKAELDRGLAVTRAHLTAVAAGEPLERDVILRGAPCRDIQPAEALALYERTPGLFVLDVRTPAEFASAHIPRSHLIPLDDLEDRLHELPPRDTPMLVHCAAGGRSAAACEMLAQRGYAQLLNLVGGIQAWAGPTVAGESAPPPPAGTTVSYRGGHVTGEQVVAAIRECFDPEIPLNIYDLGLIYGIDIDESAIAVKMTLTSEGCPSARTIPEEVRRRIAALGQPNVTVDVVWEPPWHPSRISPDGKQKLGLA